METSLIRSYNRIITEVITPIRTNGKINFGNLRKIRICTTYHVDNPPLNDIRNFLKYEFYTAYSIENANQIFECL